MGIFDTNSEERERIRKRAEKFAREQGMRGEDGSQAPEEEGIEELDLEESVPGGAFLGTLSPAGALRKLGKEAVEMAGREGAEAASKGLIRKLRKDGPDIQEGFFRKEYDITSKPGVLTYSKKR